MGEPQVLYKTEQISQNVTDKVDFVKLHQKIKKPLTTQETMRLIDVIYNGEKYYQGRLLTEYKNKKLHRKICGVNFCKTNP